MSRVPNPSPAAAAAAVRLRQGHLTSSLTTPVMRARSGLAPARGGSIARDSIDAMAQLQQLTRDLGAVNDRLGNVDTEALDDAGYDRWAGVMDAVELALERARGALQAGPSALFEREMQRLHGSLGMLADNLIYHRDDQQVIDAAAEWMGALERVIVLGR